MIYMVTSDWILNQLRIRIALLLISNFNGSKKMELRYPAPPPPPPRAREKMHFAQQRFCGLTAGLTRCGFPQRDSVSKINMAEERGRYVQRSFLRPKQEW